MSPIKIWPKNFGLMSHTQPNGMCYSHFSNGVRNSRRNGADYQNWACTYRGADCIQNIIHEKCGHSMVNGFEIKMMVKSGAIKFLGLF